MVPHLDRPICEPVQLQAGAQLRLRRIAEGADALANAPFPHYHDVCELVLFGCVDGEFVAEGRRWTLSSGCIVFVPSLRQHDYALQGGARYWTLVQLAPTTVEALAAAPGGERLRGAFCAKPAAAMAARIGMLRDWLLETGEDDPMSPSLAMLLLRAAAAAPSLQASADAVDEDSLRRLRPAIEALRRDPARAPSAEQAAALCALSPAYFSRRFHQQLGMAWSEYVRAHRLHLAGQLLLETRRSAAAIAAELGFSSPSHFGGLFLQRFGLSPAAYRTAGRR